MATSEDEDAGRSLGPPVRWVRAFWDEPDLIGPSADGLDGSCMTFLYEFDQLGGVLRVVELLGPPGTPVGAASLAEFWELQGYRRQAATPALLQHQARYGAVPEGSERDWGDYPHEAITAAEFELAWGMARRHLDQRPRDSHFL